MLHARPARVRARRRMTGIAMTTVALFALSACGGDPEAQETVGPTAGSDPSSTAQAYEPTLPPYTSDVDLTDEETEQVEETLLAINQLFFYASSLSPDSLAGLEELASAKMISAEMYESHKDLATVAKRENQELVGSMDVTEVAVWEHEEDEFGYFGVCLDYNSWGLVDAETGLTDEGEEPPNSRLQMATLKAYYDNGKPVLQDLLFGAPEDECNNL